MKKMIQAGLIVSSLASVATADIFHSVTLSQDGSLDLMVRAPFTHIKSIYVTDMSPNNILKATFTIDLEGASHNAYHVNLDHKEALPVCQDDIDLPIGAIFLAVNDADSNAYEVEHINYRPCYEETPPVYHFETEHPYANNTHTTQEFPKYCGEEGEECIAEGSYLYAHIQGVTENNYDFITIYQGNTQIARFSGNIDEKLLLDEHRTTRIVFDSDYSITKNGVTVDLEVGQEEK